MILSLVFFCLAAISNAITDNLSHHFYKSIFNTNKLNRRFWDEEVSNKLPKFLPYTDYKWSAWHVFKSLWIVLVACSAVCLYGNRYSLEWYMYPVILIVYGVCWISVFNIFYNRLLNKF